MNAFKQFIHGTRQNKLFAVVVILICLGVIEFTTHFFSEMPTKITGSAPIVAVVQTVQQDVRQKPVEENGWYRAEPQTEIMRGDAIYSGRQSRSQVQMKSGGILELGDETLVIFDDVDGVTIPDVARGQVKLKVSGQMRIAISGEVTEFTGAQSELLLNADGKAGNIRALKGQTSISRRGITARSLVTGQVLDLPIVKSNRAVPKIEIPKAGDLISEVRISEKRKVAEPSTTPLKPIEFSEPVVELPPLPAAPVPEPAQAPQVVEATVAPMPAEPVAVTEALAPAEPAQNVTRVMKVQEVYQRRGQRALVPRVGLKTLKVPVALSWHGSKTDDKVIVQVSKEKDFAKPWVEKEATGPNVVVPEWKPGRNYWRVSRDRQNWSEPAEVIVKPSVAVTQSPSVAALNRKLVVYPKGQGPEAQAKLRFQDAGLAKPRGWVLQGSNTPDFAPRKTRTVYVKDSRIDVPIARPGKYFFRVRSVADAGEISSFSGPIEIEAAKGFVKPVELAPRMAKKAEKKRDVAAVEEKKEEFKPEEPVARQTSKVQTKTEPNDLRPRPWRVTIEGGETALVSSEQIGVEANPASTHVIGLRVGYANEKNSGSLAYHSKFGASNAEGAALSNSRISLRYTRWWQTRFQALRLGWAGGFDSYRNSGAAIVYTKGYDAAKTGLDVGISIADRWKTGGDILIGTWTDSSRTYEFGGFISYEISRELAFGVGYRLSLFDAATDATAPVALPYREAMGEAYSALQFSF